ncbi:MAG: FxsA family protein [Salinibacter sp.]
MLGRLLLLFLLTPAVELGLLIQVDRLIGFWPTIGLIILTGIAGSYLARREGVSAWRRLNSRLNAGELPGKELADGVIILVAGALLITPGVLTDAFGFLGLLPPTRALIRRVVMKRLRSRMEDGSMKVQFGVFGGASPGGPSPSPPGSDAASDHRGSKDWDGTGRRVPGHRSSNGSSADGSSSSESSSTDSTP